MSVTPPDMVGRSQSVGQLMSWSTMPFASVAAGGLLAAFGGATAMLVLVGSAALVAMIPTLSASVRSVPRPAEWDTSTGAGPGGAVAAAPAAVA